MAGAKKATTPDVEKVILVACESITHDGQAALPGAIFLALPDDVEGLIATGLAEVAPVEEKAAE